MAQPRRTKRRASQTTDFHEALPLALPSVATLPHVAEHFEETATAWRDHLRDILAHRRHFSLRQFASRSRTSAAAIITSQRRLLGRLKPYGGWLFQQAARAGLLTTERLIATLRQGRLTMLFSTNAALTYAPAIAWDLESTAHRSAKRLASRRARVIYVSLAITGAIVIIGSLSAMALNTLSSYANDLSSPAVIMAKKKTGTTILDRNGQVLFQGYGAQATQPADLSQLPQSLKDATLAAEDPNFYDHPGFSWEGYVRAAWVDVTHGSTAEGGSTLTQQLVKNALLTQDKSFTRKYQELLLSMKIEQRYSKNQILSMYLGGIYYGQGAAGVQAAAQTYFHKDAKNLTLGESALIAGLPLGPSRFDPNYDLDAATGRRDYVLSRLLSLGKITKAQADAAKAQPIVLATNVADGSAKNPMVVYAKQVNIKAPHFVFYVLDQLRQQYGDQMVEQGGITVKTTLDLHDQQIGEQAVAGQISKLADHHVTNGGLISIEPSSGNILAMVGSVDYNAPGFGNVNVTLSDLQPGSSFKPIAYVTAFEKGWTGATTIDDEPVSYPSGDGTVYAPQNYDLKFHGKVTVRHALDNSLNIPAVKTLQFAGIPDTLKTAHDLGITTLNDPSRYGLSLVLGGGEVRPIDMATVYATFANLGTKIEPRAILSVSDRFGNNITKPATTQSQNVLDPRYAYMITSILSDDSARQPEFPANGPLHLSRPAAAKTGTTNDFRDNWTVGYTPQVATAVWVGNNDHTAMQNVDGITGAAPIWHEYMEGVMAQYPVQNFSQPAGLTTASVCSDGSLADGWNTGTTEVFPDGELPTSHCSTPQPVLPPTSSPTPTDPQAVIQNTEELLKRARNNFPNPFGNPGPQ